MKNLILQGLRLGQKVSKGFRKWLKDKMGKCVNCAKSVVQIFAESLKCLKSLMQIYATSATSASANFVGKESNESTEMYRVKSRITTTCLRLASVFTSTRIRLASLICLCMLTVGSGNVWGATYTYRLVISKASLKDGGKYVLLVNNRTTAYNNTVSSGHLQTAKTFSSSATTAGSAVTTTNAADQIIYVTLVKKSGDTYYILDSGGKYITASKASSGGMARSDADTYGWTFYGTSGLDAIYEKAYSSKYASFRCYNNGSFRSYTAVNHTSASTSGATFYLASGCSVTYDGNGKTDGTIPTDAYLYGEGGTVTVKSNSGSLVRTGYTFAGWNTKADGSGTNYTAGSGTFSITGDITLYAKWVAAGTSVSLSKGAETNGTFSLSTSSVTTTSSAQTVTVTCSPNAGYYVSAISATNPATCPSAITYGGSNNSRTVTYPTGANGESTISVTFSPIWYLKGDFNSWGATLPLTDITTNVATVDISLAKTKKYEFKVYNAQEDAWYGNNGKIIEDRSGWVFSTSEGNCTVFATVADDYTFNFNISNKQMQVIYPTMTHPNDAYVYLTKWWDCYVHWWYTDGGGDHALSDWGSDLSITREDEICETDYWCVPILEGYPKLIMKDAAGDAGNSTGDQVTTDHGGKYITHDGSWGWHNFETYTVSYAAGTGGSGSMSSHTDLCPGSNQALSTNTFTQDHYHFSGWVANVDVKIGGATVTAGTLIAGGSTIQDIRSNITLTAQWEINSHTLTWSWGGGSTTSTTYTLYPATSGSLNYNASITKPANGTMSKTGYNFSSWSSSATTMPDNDLTITAQWSAKTYTITLDREGGTTGATSLTMTYNSSSFTGWTAPTKAGYTFGGYYKDDDGTGAQTINASGVLQASTAYTGAGGIWTNDGAVTLYAKWTANNYTVTLNDEGGSGGSGSKSVTYNTNTNLTTNVAVPTKSGYDFRGYYTSAGGSGTKVINGAGAWIIGTAYVNAGGNWIGTSNIELHAYWTATTYNNYRTSCSATAKTITIVPVAGGTVTTSPSGSAEPDDVVTITLTPDAHYNAGGAPTVIDENDDPVAVSGSGTTYTFTMPDADVTITPAAWSPINVTIYWHRKTGTTPEAVLEGTTGKTFPNTTDVDAECAPFLGWIAGEVWADSPDKPATYYEYGDAMPGPINANVHYTAIYGEIEMHETSAYVKVTSAPSNWSGDYLIVRDDNSRAFDGSLSTLDAADNYIGVTISAGTIVANSTVNASKWTIAKVGETSNYTIKSASGYYIGRTSNSNGLNSSTSEEYTNTLAYSTDHVDITSSAGPKLQMNGGTRFRYYGTSQQVLQLYKLGIAEVPTTTYTKNPACTPKYHVTVNSATGGSPSSDKTLEPEGETITLTANPGAGYAFTEWAMENSSTHADATSLLSSSTATTATFSMPAYDVTVTATYAKKMVTELKVMDDETVVANTTGPVSGTLNVSTGANKTLDVAITPGDAFDHSWTATVTAGGTYASITNVTAEGFRVNGLAQGDATVTMRASNDEAHGGTPKTVTFTVHVTDIMPEEIILKRDGSVAEIETLTMYYDAANSRGQYVKVNVSYSPTPTNKNFTFSSAATGKVGSHSHSNVNGYEVLVANGVTTDPVNCTFTSEADGSVTKVLAVTVLPLLTDRFVDYIQGNATQTRTAALSADRYSLLLDITTPTLTDASDADPTSADCKTAHYHMIGWLPQATAEALWAAGTAITEDTEGLVSAGATVEATGQTWYAIWAKEE